jgi:hypothetical protein
MSRGGRGGCGARRVEGEKDGLLDLDVIGTVGVVLAGGDVDGNV